MANDSSVIVRLRLLGASAFSRDAQRAGRNLGSIGRSGRAATVGLKGVGAAATATRTGLTLLGTAAGFGMAGGLAKGVGASVNFEQAMANVQARLLTTKGNMQLLSDQAIDLGGKTAFSANEAASAMGEFAAAGFSTAQIMKIMPGTLDLAAASGTELAFAAETTGALIRQFGLRASDAGHVADLLTVAVNRSAISMDDMALTMKYVGPVAGRFNQSIEDIGAATAILGNVGIKGETAGTTLRRAFVNIVKPSVRTQNVLEGMGITTDEFSKATVNAKGELRAFPSILGNLAGHFKDLSAPDQRKALAQLFGVEALPGMLTLMGMGEDKIRKMSAALTNSQGAAKKTAGIMRGTVAGAWDQFTGSLETAAIRFTRSSMPALRKGLLGTAELITSITSGGVGGSGNVRGGFMQGFKGGPQAPLSGMAGAAQKAGVFVRKFGSIAVTAGRDLLEAFKPAMPFFENILLPLLKGVAIGVLGGVVMAFKIMVPVIRIAATALGWIGTVAKPLRPVFQGIGTVIGFLLGGPILGLLGKLPQVGIVFRLLAVPIRFTASVMRGVVSVAGRVVGVFGRVFTAATRLGATLPGVWRTISVSVGNFVGGVITKITGLIGKIRGLAGRFMSAGGSIVKAIGRGIATAFGSGVGLAANIGRKLADWLNRATPLGDEVKLPGPLPDFRLPALATGGVVRRGGLAVVGERGPELADLPTGATVYDNRTSRRARAAVEGGGVIELTANLYLSGRQVHSEVFRVDRKLAEAA